MGEAGGVGAHGNGARCAAREWKGKSVFGTRGRGKLQRYGGWRIDFEGFLIGPARVPQ